MIFRHRVKINGVHYPAGVDVPVEEEKKEGAVEMTAPIIDEILPEPETPVEEVVEKPQPKKRGRAKKS